MSQYLPIILLSAALAFVVTPGTRWLAARWGAVAQPGVRRVHRSPVPLLGGIALYLGVTLAFVAFGQRDWMTEGIGILGGATLMFLTGLWDDRFGLSPRVKLGANLVAGLFLIGFGVQVRLFDVGPLDWMITLVWVVGITNAVNLMDNMDGLAAGITATGAAVFFGLAAAQGQGLVASLAAALFGSAMGFLFYNFAPAVSFMGDAGALPLGFLLAALAIQLEFRTLPLASTWMAPILWIGPHLASARAARVEPAARGADALRRRPGARGVGLPDDHAAAVAGQSRLCGSPGVRAGGALLAGAGRACPGGRPGGGLGARVGAGSVEGVAGSARAQPRPDDPARRPTPLGIGPWPNRRGGPFGRAWRRA
jgi:UDP-GlcNAc:undecaprenyl-phosphate GlcNAc-1-phosphate transferase